MRITNTMVERSALSGLQRNLAQVMTAQSQVSSGLRVQKVSDDPAAASQDMSARGSIRAIDQYRRNVQAGLARSQEEDTVLGTLGDLLTRAKELALSQGGDTANADTRLTTKAEVDQLLNEAVSLGNTRSADSYLFGGAKSQTEPFPSSAPPFIDAGGAGPTGQPQTELGAGDYLPSTHNGTQVFMQSGALQALHDLSQALGGNDAAGIRTAAGSLDNAFSSVQQLVGDVGAWENQFQITSANLDALETNLKSFKSSLTDADTEQAVTELVSRQTTYQAAMLATSRIMSLTLTDYLR